MEVQYQARWIHRFVATALKPKTVELAYADDQDNITLRIDGKLVEGKLSQGAEQFLAKPKATRSRKPKAVAEAAPEVPASHGENAEDSATIGQNG